LFRALLGAAAEVEDVAALDEERALLVELRLERREVDDRGVDLDLAEVRVERRVQRHVRREPVLEVEPERGEVVGAIAVRVGERRAIARRHRRVLRARDAVRQQLEPAAAVDAADAGEVAVARDAAALAPGREGEDGLLLPSCDGALELDAPELLLASAEPELAERNPQLDAPAVRRDGGPGLPHGVPGLVALVLVPAGEDLVAAHAGR